MENGPLAASGVVARDAAKRAAVADGGFASWTLGTLADWTHRNLGSSAPAPVEALAC